MAQRAGQPWFGMVEGMVDVLLTAFGVLALGIAALSDRMRRLPVSVPLLGLVTGAVLGPAALSTLNVPTVVEAHSEGHELTRVLLAVSVMAVALRYPLGEARSRWRPVVWLVLVAMPVMAAVTSLLGAAVLGLGVGAAVLLGAALAPTDPVLASSTVTGGPAERHLTARDRQILSLESGANDGLALPLVLGAVAVAGAASATGAVLESVWQVLGGVVVGTAVGALGGKALRLGDEHGSTEPGPALLFTMLLALAVLGVSGLLHVDGVLAVFVAGLAFSAVATGGERGAEEPIDEAVNRFLVLPLFVLFGAALPWQEWGQLGWPLATFVAAVLLLRRLPVVLALRGPLGLGRADAAYLGWFGPMGVSALFYLTMEADRVGVDERVLGAGAAVVAASTVAHAVTAPLGLALYRRFHGDARDRGRMTHESKGTP